MPPIPYDLVVIGSGPAGEQGAMAASLLGKRVAVVEKNPHLGGASANTGTLPSKTLRETALALSGFRARELYGVDLSLRREATIRDFMHHEARVKDSERLRVRVNLHERKAELYEGAAQFVDPHVVKVTDANGGETLLRGDYILIATGSSPVHPEGFRFEDDRIHDSDEILSLDRLPRSLAVVGAGVIGSEYACTFAALGADVHIVDGRDCLMPFLDREVSQELEKGMSHLGIQFHWKEQVKSCGACGDNQIELQNASGTMLRVEGVLVAAGRQSNTGQLNLAAAGLTPGNRGLIVVDSCFRSSVPHIYAAGDVIGFPALASTSAEQARIAVTHAFGGYYKKDAANLLPTGIYTIPEAAMVGETEESLKKQGVDYVAGRSYYAASARGRIIGDYHGFLKLLFRRDNMKLLGIHIVGEQATELVHIGMMAMQAGASAQIFIDACFNYPTLGELYKNATFNALLKVSRPAATSTSAD
jgi:NAD(P) transhydrogenase